MNQNKRISPLFNQCLSIVMAVALVATWIVPARVDAQDTASSSGGCSLVDCRGRGGCASCVVVVA